MRKVILMLAVILLTLTVGCTKEREIIVVVPNVEVHLNTKQYFNVEEGSLFRAATTRSTYVHEYPTNYKAYFIANENKGNYKIGQLVETIDVTKGTHTVVVPKLSYKVYVTNFSKPGSSNWYTEDNAVEQMPKATNTLYLYGMSEIDYSTKVDGEVIVKNPYAAVMIQNHPRIPNAPKYGDSNISYISTGEGWWLKYIRNETTNTKIVVTGGKNITLNDSITANKIYKYTLLTHTDTGGNFTVKVEEFEATEDRVIEVQ